MLSLGFSLAAVANVLTVGGVAPPPPPVDADATAYLAAWAPAPTTDQEASVRALFAGLKAGGIWPLLDHLYLFAKASSAASALVNAKNPAQSAVAQLLPTWSDAGFQMVATSSNVEFPSNLAFSGSQFAQDSGHVGIWAFGGSTSTGAFTFGGLISTGTTGGSRILASRGATGTFGVNVAATADYDLMPALATRTGGFIANRTGPATTDFFVDGVSTVTSDAPSATPRTSNWTIGRNASAYNAVDTFQAASSGGGLSPTQAANLSTLISQYVAGTVPVIDMANVVETDNDAVWTGRPVGTNVVGDDNNATWSF